jgi:monofunctional glycosyltransferase
MHFHASLNETWRMVKEVARPRRVFGRFARGLAGLFIIGNAVLLVCILFASLVLLKWNPPVTALMVYRALTVGQKSQPIRFVPLRQIPRVARLMTIRLEDYHFYQHRGVDLGALREAWQINAAIGRTAVGGSTIPMQLARNLFLTPRKTYFRKYVESVIALEMDFIMPKDRILELYLNCIEWGKGIFGIGAASSYYYKAGVGGLGLDELRRLVTIITNPLRYNVETFYKSAQMAQRYAFLESRYPDPSAEPAETGPVALVPDAPLTEPEAAAAGPPGPDASTPPAPSVSPATVPQPVEAPTPTPRQVPGAVPEAKTATGETNPGSP